jgi:hypothetical protein
MENRLQSKRDLLRLTTDFKSNWTYIGLAIPSPTFLRFYKHVIASGYQMTRTLLPFIAKRIKIMKESLNWN